MGNTCINLAIRYGTKTSVIRVAGSLLFPMEKWYGTVLRDWNVFGKSNCHPDGQPKCDLTLDLSGSIPPLPMTFIDDEAIVAILFIIRVMHAAHPKKGNVGLGIKHIILVHHMDAVLGLNESYRSWMRESLDPYLRDLSLRVERDIPISAEDWETTLLACQTINYRAGYAIAAAALIRSSTLSQPTESPGNSRLKPTGDGLVDGTICGELAIHTLVTIRDTVLQYIIATAQAGVVRYNKSRADSAACRLCIPARFGALLGAVGDLGIWPSKKPADLAGVSVWSLQRRMEEIGDGVNCPLRVAKYVGTCCGAEHEANGDNLFAIQDVACDIWYEIQLRISREVWGHAFMDELFGSER